jgi:hypothetical protein
MSIVVATTTTTTKFWQPSFQSFPLESMGLEI